MAVKKHGNNWRADWRDEIGIRHRKDFDLKADAENYYMTQQQAVRTARDERKSDGPPLCDPSITLKDYAARFLAKRPALNVDQATINRQRIDLDGHILPVFGKAPVRKISRARVREFLLDKLASGTSRQGLKADSTQTGRKPLARGSVRSIYHTLSAVLSEAVEERLIREHPLRRLWKTLNKGAKQDVAKTIEALDAEQAREFLVAAKVKAPEFYPYFATLAWAGLRPGEGLAVTPDKIDLSRSELRIDQQIGQTGGLKRTKTGEPRKVDLSKRLAAVIDETIRARQVDRAFEQATEGVVKLGRPVGPWLFFPDLGPSPTEKDAQRVYKNALRAMRRCLEAAGLPAYFGLHSLRHTYGSNLIAAGVSPAYVQQQMGHASIQQTVDTYGSWLPIRVPGAVDAFSEATAPEGPRGHQMDTAERKTGVGAA